MRNYRKSLIATFFLLCSFPVLAGVVVVVHPDNRSELDELQVKNIFLGKQSAYPDGSEVFPIDQEKGAARDAFLKNVLKRDEASLNSYWARMLFSSKGRPPVTAENSLAIRRMIGSNRKAIGYMDSSEVDGSVRVVLTIP